MIKTLWFMMKVIVVVGLALWVAENPGFVEISWLDYTLNVHVGVFMILLTAVILLSIFIYRIISTFVDFPKSYRRYQEIKNREKGYKALTLGLTAVAAGDVKAAVCQAERAGKLLDDGAGLVLLLQAQAARLDGREGDAQKSFVALLENEDAAFLGVRGLLQTALDQHSYGEALDLGRRALNIHPKQPWILKIVYDLEVRARDWNAARRTLDRAAKYGALSADKAKSDRLAILLVEAEALLENDERSAALSKAAKAYKIDPGFVPAAVCLAKLYHQTGKRRKAIGVIQKAWKLAPHPELAEVWDILAKSSRVKKKSVGRMQWFEKLLALNSDTDVAQVAAGRIALDEGLWGKARSYFSRAEEISPNAELYRLFASLEERSGDHEEEALLWLEKAAEAPVGKAWICRDTGHVYERWSPIAQPHGAFNTIEWQDMHSVIEAGMLGVQGAVIGGLLETPKRAS